MTILRSALGEMEITPNDTTSQHGQNEVFSSVNVKDV